MRRTVGRRGVPEMVEYGKLALAAALAGAIGYVLLGAASRFLAWETVFGSMIRLAGGAAAIGGIYFLLAFLFHSGRSGRSIGERTCSTRPGSRRHEGAAAPQGPAQKPLSGGG